MDWKNPLKDMSKPMRYATIAGALGIGGYMVYRHHSTTGSWNPWSSTPSGTSNSAGTSTSIDPITGMAYTDDNATDPITGQTYLAEATQYGSVAAAEASVSAYGQSTATGSGIPVNPASPASTGSINTPVGTNVYTSNAAWAQAVTAGLVSVGYDGPTVAAALGAYETETPLTPAQIKIVNTAIAEYGPAPTGNLQIIAAPASGPGASTPVTAPTVSGGKVVSVTQTAATLSWTGNNATKYTVTLTGPGKSNGQVSNITRTTISYKTLEADHNYNIQILPYNSSGTPGKVVAIDFHTLAGKPV